MPGLADLKNYLKDKRKAGDFYSMTREVSPDNPNKIIDPSAVDAQEKLSTNYVSALSRILKDARSGRTQDIEKLNKRINKTVDRYHKSAYYIGKQAITGEKTLKKPGDRHQKIPTIPTKRDKELLDKVTTRESLFFKNFVKDYVFKPDNVKIKDADGKKVSLREKAGHIDYDKRLQMYKGAIDGSFKKGMVSGVIDSVDEDVEIWWELSPFCKHCASCILLAAMSPYNKNTLKTTPGAGDTKCGHACKCKLRFVSKKTGRELMSTNGEEDSPYVYKGEVSAPIKQELDDGGFKINYYRQMAEVADTEEERDYYLQMRRKANEDVHQIALTNKVKIAPKLAVGDELVPSVKTIANESSVIQHEAKSSLAPKKRIGVLKGTNYRIGFVGTNDGKNSLQVLFGNRVEQIDYDKAVLFDNADIMSKQASEKMIEDIKLVNQNKKSIYAVAEKYMNNELALDNPKQMGIIQQFVKDSIQMQMGDAQIKAIDWFTKIDINNLNKTIIKDFIKKSVTTGTLKKILTEGLSPFVPKTKVGKAAILLKNKKGIPAIPSLPGETTANLINYEKALAKFPIYQNDIVWRTGAHSKEELDNLVNYLLKNKYYRNVALIQGKPIGLDTPLDLDYQIKYIINSKRGRAGNLLLPSASDDKFDVFLNRGSLFKVQDIEWERDKLLKIHMDELLDADINNLVPVLDKVDKVTSKNSIKELIGSTTPPSFTPPSSKAMNNFLKKDIVITDATDIVKLKPFMENNFTKKIGEDKLASLIKSYNDFKKTSDVPISKSLSTGAIGKIEDPNVKAIQKVFKKIDETNINTLLIDSNWEKALTATEKEALDDYLGAAYDPINQYLRGTIEEKDLLELLETKFEATKEELLKDIKNVKTALEKASIKEDIILYRGGSLDALKANGIELKPGLTFTDKGFASTSINEKTAKHFSDLALFDDEDAITFEIHAPKGTKGAYTKNLGSFMSGEEEVLLKDNSRFKVIDIVQEEDGIAKKLGKNRYRAIIEIINE